MTNAKKPGETIPEKSKDRIDLSESSIMFVFQNHLGLQFLKKTNIVLFRFISSQPSKGACWELLLANNSTFKLSHTDTAEKIMKMLPRANFFQISQHLLSISPSWAKSPIKHMDANWPNLSIILNSPSRVSSC